MNYDVINATTLEKDQKIHVSQNTAECKSETKYYNQKIDALDSY